MEQFTHVDISNASRWFYEVNDRHQYNWVDDFPCLMSPWPNAIYKWRQPRFARGGDGQAVEFPYVGCEHETRVSRFAINNDVVIDGSLFDDFVFWLAGARPELVYENKDRLIDWIIYNEIQCRWGQVFVHRFHRPASAGDIEFAMLLLLDAEGHFIGNQDCGMLVLGGEAVRLVGGGLTNLLIPLAFTLSLLNCRNVEVRDRPVSRQQRRLAERKGQPVTVYKELVVDAFRRQVRSEVTAGGGSEVKRVMHICRGHFVTYTEDNPLFGKHVGTFWKDMHVRGRQSAGKVHKTYSVNGPQDMTSVGVQRQ